jgi:hypothetical protein
LGLGRWLRGRLRHHKFVHDPTRPFGNRERGLSPLLRQTRRTFIRFRLDALMVGRALRTRTRACVDDDDDDGDLLCCCCCVCVCVCVERERVCGRQQYTRRRGWCKELKAERTLGQRARQTTADGVVSSDEVQGAPGGARRRAQRAELEPTSRARRCRHQPWALGGTRGQRRAARPAAVAGW